MTTSTSPAPAAAPRPTADRLLFVEEVAEMLRRTPASIRYMVHKGIAPRSAKIGGRRMFRESDVLAWIESSFDTDEQEGSTAA